MKNGVNPEPKEVFRMDPITVELQKLKVEMEHRATKEDFANAKQEFASARADFFLKTVDVERTFHFTVRWIVTTAITLFILLTAVFSLVVSIIVRSSGG